MPGTFSIGTLAGIAFRVRVSALLAFLGLLWFLAAWYLPAAFPSERALTHWSLAFLSTLSLYLSTIAHELGHCLAARARSVRVQTITLSLFGGSSDIRSEEQKALDEFLISLAGPVVSGCAATIALGVRLALPSPSPPLTLLLEALFLLNLWLSAFNALPMLPLDGGRALRGLLWHLQGDYLRATRAATTVGRVLAAAVAAGSLALFILSFDGGKVPLLASLGSDARFFALLGLLAAWFLNNAARNAYRQALLQHRLGGLTVSQLMTPNPPVVSPAVHLDEILSHHLQAGGQRAVAVVRGDNVLVGLVTWSDIAKVPAKERGARTAGEVMTAAAALVTVSPDDPVDIAIQHMAQRHLNQLPVLSDGRVVGMIARRNVLRLADAEIN